MNETSETRVAPGLRWLLPLVLGAIALVVYLATLSRGPFPGLPAKSLVWQLGLDASPVLVDSLWGYLMRLLDFLSNGHIVFWAGIASAVFGAISVALMTLLMMRVRYQVHDAHDPDETRREEQACLLAGTVAGLFVLACIPVWVLSTRSLPGTFHLAMLLGAAISFSEYQRTGKPGRLYLLGLLFGAGIAEFATFWVFAPLAALLVVRAMLQRAEFSLRVLVRTALCVLPGLLLYVLNGWYLWQDSGVRLRGFGSLWSVIWFIWRDQWHLIVDAPQTAGFLLVMALTVVPWGMLFLMRAKKPAWRYSMWQVLLHLIVLAVAMATLFDAPLSPWHFFGMSYVMATPYLILAACAAYTTGEFWVMGQTREHRNAGIGQPLRRLMAVLGLCVPPALLVAAYFNLPVTDGRFGQDLEVLANQVLDNLQGRNVLISDGVLDDAIRLQAHERRMAVQVITLPRTDSLPYRQYIARQFPDSRQQSLLQVGFAAFLQEFLSSDAGLQRTAAIDVADPLREYGYLVPDRLIYRAEPAEDRIDLPALIATQKAFWAWLAKRTAVPLDPRNPARSYQQYVLRLVSKVANNTGFMQVERGDKAGAVESFKQARVFDADNISALLNLLTLAQMDQLPEEKEYQAAWDDFKSRHVDSRVMWSLATLYGYVYNTGYLVRQGMMWAVSGKPRIAEAELRRAAKGQAVDATVKAFLGRAYLHGGDLQKSAEYYRAALKDNPNDRESLMFLADIAMRDGDYAGAEDLLRQVEAAGVAPAQIRFERIALAYLRGQGADAVVQLKDLLAQDKGNVRGWALLAMLTSDGRDPKAYEQALKALKELQGSSPDVRLMLAELYFGRQEWTAARDELDQLTRMNPRNIRAWELLVDVDFHERKRELAEDHVRELLTLDPENFTGNLMLGSFQYARGQFSLAESSYRTALRARRDPMALNDLAYLLMLNKDGRGEEARTLIEEALVLQPNNPICLSTRSELNLREGRLDEAEQDLQQVLAALPDQPQALLLSAQLYAERARRLQAGGQADAARRQKEAALDLAKTLADRMGELPPEQQLKLQELLKDAP